MNYDKETKLGCLILIIFMALFWTLVIAALVNIFTP